MRSWAELTTAGVLATLPADLAAVYAAWLDGAGDFAFVPDNPGPGGTVTGYAGPGGVVVIPQQINGVTVTAVGSDAFASNQGITAVAVASSVKSLGDRAFYNCQSLKWVRLPAGLETVGTACFSTCESLEAATFGSGVLIGLYAFAYCGTLRRVNFFGLPTIGSDNPNMYPYVLMASAPAIFYGEGAEGFSPEWCGRPTQPFGLDEALDDEGYYSQVTADTPRLLRLGALVSGIVSEFRAASGAEADPVGKTNESSIPEACYRHACAIIWYNLAMEMGFENLGKYEAAWQNAEVYLRSMYVTLRLGKAGGVAGTPRYGQKAAATAAPIPAGADAADGRDGGGGSGSGYISLGGEGDVQ